VDLTDWLESFVADSGIRLGLLNVQTLHTTTAVVVNEHEPLLLADFATDARGHDPEPQRLPARRPVGAHRST
jgi:thiamine phosphate synthase YjbQ (UPF0047 family)